MNARNARAGTAEAAATRNWSERPRTLDLARRVRALRAKSGMTLKELSVRSKISISALSKLENGQLSPTYENIVRLAHGLAVDITALFVDSVPAPVTGRRSITRKDAGVRCETANYDYEMLCTDLARKQMIPLLARVKANELKAFGPLIAHEGEEVIYVLSGKIVLHTEYYEPRLLETGDCAYFDSTMRHGCVTQGVEDAVVFWVCSSGTVDALVRRATELSSPRTVSELKSGERKSPRQKRSSARR
jgi:transcriptional regulator with XRE-family HTH domain